MKKTIKYLLVTILAVFLLLTLNEPKVFAARKTWVYGDYNTRILNRALKLGSGLKLYGWKYDAMNTRYGYDIYHPIVNTKNKYSPQIVYVKNNNVYIDTGFKGISCATFVSEVLAQENLYTKGTRTVWARKNASARSVQEEVTQAFYDNGIVVAIVEDSKNAKPGDILMWKGTSSNCHMCILTKINRKDGYFVKTGSPEVFTQYTNNQRLSRSRPYNELSKNWVIYRVVAVYK